MKKLLLLFLFLNSAFHAQGQVKFAAFGDYGVDNSNELAVSLLVKSWNPDFIVTTGDNNYYYSVNGADSIDHKIGRYYQEFIKPYMGNYGSGSTPINRFFPALGNHDLYDGIYYGPNDIRYTGYTYYNYFKLTDPIVVKGNTPDIWSPLGVRYYTFIKGNIQFFIVNTGLLPENHSAWLYSEPDGVDSNSVQAQWIKTQLNNSSATWKIVVLHHPPYVSHQSIDLWSVLRWNFKQWGANLVLSGHIHFYERLNIDGLTYVISGLGGAKRNTQGSLPPQRPGSITLYTSQYGANLFQAYDDSLVGKFINVNNEVIDDFKIVTGQTASTDAGVSNANVTNPGIIYTGGNYCFDAQVTNFGSNNLFFVPVQYSVNGGPLVGPVSTGAINSGSSTTVSFCESNSFTPVAPGDYTLKFFTSLTGDMNHNNDTTTLLLTVIDSSRDAGVTAASTTISEPIYTGTTVSFNATVNNFGLANLPSVPVRYKVNNDPPTATLNTGSINSGNSTSILFTGSQSFTPVAAGSYTLKFYTTLSGDMDHSNDTTTLLLTVIDSSRDAGVTTAVTTISGRIYTGTNVSFNATVKNFGVANLPSVPVRYKVNNDPPTIILNTGAINSGDSLSILFTGSQSFTPVAAGSYTLKFYTTLAGDNNHSNDTTTLLLNVIDSSRDAGVTTASTTISGPIYTGTNVSFNATVKNFGVANLPSVPVRYKVNNNPPTITLNTGAINSGDSLSILFTGSQSFTPIAAGSYTLKFYTTLAGDINHSNDTTTLQLTVIDSSRDAGVTAASRTTSGPIYTGTNVSLNATVKNFGLANLPTVPVRYKVVGDSNITTLNTGLMNSGDTAALMFTSAQSFRPAAAGSYTLKFYTTLAGDTNFSNDTTTLQLNVIDSSRDAGVIAVSKTISGSIYARTNVSFNVKVKNFGVANLPSVPVSYRVDNDSAMTTMNAGAINSGDTSSILYTGSQSFTPAVRGNYILKFFTSLTGDTNFSNDTTTLLLSVIDSIGTTIFISVIPEGLFNKITSELNLRDTVKAYLREVNSPYSIVDSDAAVIDSVTFEGEFKFMNAPNGTYYIVITHRNSIETWSRYGFTTFSTSLALSYTFTASQSAAYGNNMIKVDPILNNYAIYSGDINQDGSIDGSDLSLIDNAAFEFVVGYVVQDCNGDAVVDGSDALIASNNAENFITKITP